MNMNKDVNDILNNFDFEKVKDVMDALDWKYWDSEEDTVSIYELRKTARYLLTTVYNAPNSPHQHLSTGGFEAERRMYPGDSKKYLHLKFVVEEVNTADFEGATNAD